MLLRLDYNEEFGLSHICLDFPFPCTGSDRDQLVEREWRREEEDGRAQYLRSRTARETKPSSGKENVELTSIKHRLEKGRRADEGCYGR